MRIKFTTEPTNNCGSPKNSGTTNKRTFRITNLNLDFSRICSFLKSNA